MKSKNILTGERKIMNMQKVRKQYRLIEKEKKRLHEAGVDQELVRLLCRHMVNTRNQKAQQRFWNAHLESLQYSLL
jgi:hypothetical protein